MIKHNRLINFSAVRHLQYIPQAFPDILMIPLLKSVNVEWDVASFDVFLFLIAINRTPRQLGKKGGASGRIFVSCHLELSFVSCYFGIVFCQLLFWSCLFTCFLQIIHSIMFPTTDKSDSVLPWLLSLPLWKTHTVLASFQSYGAWSYF